MSKRSNLFLKILLPLLFLFLAIIPVFGKGNKEAVPGKELIYFINYPYQIWSDDSTKIHLTLFKPDFKPAVNAVVHVDGIKSGTTDKNGICIFDFKPGNSERHTLECQLKEGGVTYSLKKGFASNARTESFQSDRLYIYTDRGLYNPGQKILIRLIGWQLKKEYTPIAGAEVKLLLQDKQGKTYTGDTLTTDNFGIAATTLPLAPQIPEGDYELVVLYQGTRETAEIRVEKFVPPVINIRHNLKRYFTDTQEELSFSVDLSYFTGGEINKSSLSILISQAGKTIFTKNLPAGGSSYRISLQPWELDQIRSALTAEQGFKITLQATDQFARNDEIEWDLLYTARPYITVLELDKDAYPAGEKVQVLAKIVDIDRQPAADLELFFEVDGAAGKTARTNEKGVAVLEFTMPDYQTTLTVTTPSVGTPLATRSIPLQALKPMLSKVNTPPGDAGSTVELTVRFHPDYIPIEKVVHVDLTDISGALVESTTIKVYEEQGLFLAKGDITAPTWGSMLANLYCCAIQKADKGKELSPEIVGFITEGQHITFYPDKRISVEIKDFKPSRAPGETFNLEVNLSGGGKEKIMGISVTDQAVLSLKDPFIKAPYEHFYSPQAKTISTGGAGVLTWPVVDRNWGSPTRDIAYSNWGWKSPGPIEKGYDDMLKGADIEPSAPSMTMMGTADEYMEAEPTTGAMAPPPPEEEKMKEVEDLDEMSISSKRQDEKEAAPEPVIVIRKEFPETALWEPFVTTDKNRASIPVKLPDTLTTQNVTILATDKEGNLGFLRQGIIVSRPLYIRTLFPAYAVAGDTLELQAMIRNNGPNEESVSPTFTAKGLSVLNQPSSPVKIGPGESRLVSWKIKADEPGPAEYTLSVKGKTASDSELRRLTILPAGSPVIQNFNGKTTAKSPFRQAVNLKEGEYHAVAIRVSLPGVLPALQEFDAFDSFPFFSPWGTAAAIIMNEAMLKYLEKGNEADSAKIEKFRNRIKEAVAALTATQLSSGGWGWFSGADMSPNVYYSVTCLRALVTARKAGFQVDSDTLMQAAGFLLAARNNNGLWSSQGAYFWEHFNVDTDNALSAEIFEVLASALEYVESSYGQQIEMVKLNIDKILASNVTEPLTLSAGIMGITYYNEARQTQVPQGFIKEQINRLISLKRTGYWEPQWYHAFGGMIELNARILELLGKIDYQQYESVIREVAEWLLSTQNALGSWHNEIGTAGTIKALLTLSAFDDIFTTGKEKPGKITILVNKSAVKEVAINPADPYQSALALRYLDLTGSMKQGENSLEVVYTGNLEASVTVELQSWGSRTQKASAALIRKAPAEIAFGQPAEISLEIAELKAPFLLIEEGIPSNTEVDTLSLERLLEQNLITGYKIADGTLFLYTTGGTPKVLKYNLTGVMRGESRHPGTVILDGSSGAIIGEEISGILTVK